MLPTREATAAAASHEAVEKLRISQKAWYLRSLLWMTLFILLLGAVEDLYGNTDSGDVYGSDAVQYLDIARAFSRHDWHSALNPLWSQGYPALLALARPLFPSGPGGDWDTTRVLNFLIFAAGYAAFLSLLFTLFPPPSTPDATPLDARPPDARQPDATQRANWLRRIAACLLLFAVVQTCLGQVSRVNPDELLTALFLLACTQMLWLLRHAARGRSTGWAALRLGLTLGVGFFVKAAFLGLGCGILLIAAWELSRQKARKRRLLAALAVFVCIVGANSAVLSHVVGYRTLGEAGSINYAWHVDRLTKWVHWEGGIQPASEAWPKPSIARFAQWDTHPPDFGTPIHPSVVLQRSPTVYGFAAPIHATYVPYFDPPYFYQGYRHVFRVRYQLIALAKSVGDLLAVFARHPFAGLFFLALVFSLRSAPARHEFLARSREHWPLLGCSLFGIALYLPVHLEGRYLAGMLLVLGTCTISAATAQISARNWIAIVLLFVGFAAELLVFQLPVGKNLLHGKSPRQNPEWRMGLAALEEHLPPNAPVGVISWTPNLHSDWAYIAHLQITSEIASGPDYDQFWHLSPDRQAATLATFRRAGARAVFVNSKPPGLGGPEWHQLGGTPLWMTRLQ